jgi:hypothetical protein
VAVASAFAANSQTGGYIVTAAVTGVHPSAAFALANTTNGGGGSGSGAGVATLAQPIVGIATTPTGHGYWLVAADGGIFAFGDATFYGSGAGTLNGQPAGGLAATPTGHGYRIATGTGQTLPAGQA